MSVAFLATDGHRPPLHRLYPLALANPVKLVTGLVMYGVSSAIYARAGQVNWEVGGWVAAGSILGAYLAVPVACSPNAQRVIYRILQVVVTAETLWLVWHWWTGRK